MVIARASLGGIGCGTPRILYRVISIQGCIPTPFARAGRKCYIHTKTNVLNFSLLQGVSGHDPAMLLCGLRALSEAAAALDLQLVAELAGAGRAANMGLNPGAESKPYPGGLQQQRPVEALPVPSYGAAGAGLSVPLGAAKPAAKPVAKPLQELPGDVPGDTCW